jgi:hypothetical protein
MGTRRTDEFCKDAARIALSGGLSSKQIADDLGIGMSTLNETSLETAQPEPLLRHRPKS